MKPELISPAGDWPSLQAAIEAGADAIYIGTKDLNMRATTKNFELNELKKITKLARKNKVKIYLTLNTIVYPDEIKKIKQILKTAKEAKIDAVHAWDFSIINECQKLKIPVHLSTQASIANVEAINTLTSKFKIIERIILARELSLEQIKEIKKKTKVEIEVFIHGAMCVSVSGRCFLSQFTFNKSANRGDCLQPCRREYTITDVEEKHKFKLGNNYILSPKDLCTLPFVDQLIDAKIDAFKIEGRNRSPEYVKIVTQVYRQVIDLYSNENLLIKKSKIKQKDFKKTKQQLMKTKKIQKEFFGPSKLKNNLLGQLKTVYNRGFSSGFFLNKPLNEWTDTYGSKATTTKTYIGKVRNYYQKIKVAEVKIETKELSIGDNIMIQGPTTGVITQKLKEMQINHKKIKKAKKGQSIAIKTTKVRPNDKVFLIVNKD